MKGGVIVALLAVAGLCHATIIIPENRCRGTQARATPFKCEANQVNSDPEGYELEHVVIVNRHSLRAPATIDNKTITFDQYPLGLGFSTRLGNQMSVHVGKIWAKFYEKFLENSTVRDIWVRSSSYPRCFETIQLVLGSMFPPKGDFDFGYPIQPITINRLEVGNDVNVENCGAVAPESLPELDNLTDPALTADGFENFGEFVKFACEKTEFDPAKTDYYEPIIDGFYCQRFNQLPVPDWAVEKWSSLDFAMRLLSYKYWVNDIPYYGNYIAKFVANRTRDVADGSNTMKMSFFSYHDTSIQAILAALGTEPVDLYPSFLAALHFQIYKKTDDGKLYVRALLHQGTTLDLGYLEAKEVILEKCPFPDCSVEKFVELMSNIYDDVDRSKCNPIVLNALQ